MESMLSSIAPPLAPFGLVATSMRACIELGLALLENILPLVETGSFHLKCGGPFQALS